MGDRYHFASRWGTALLAISLSCLPARPVLDEGDAGADRPDALPATAGSEAEGGTAVVPLDDGGACPESRASCGGACVALESNPQHCGACDRACGEGAACEEGRCVDRARSVTAGGNFGCAVFDSGNVWCWGLNQFGQTSVLGEDDATWADAGLVWRFRSPTRVPALPRAVQVSAGLHFACARTAEGSVYCWGRGSFGQLGHERAEPRCASPRPGGGGDTVACSGPLAVESLPAAVQEIATGAEHACARTDSLVYCWGSNRQGQLGAGRGDQAASATPLLVEGLNGSAKALALGAYHSCALMGDGSVRCWGESAFGQTGSDPARDPTCSFGGKCTRTPALVLGPDGQPFSGADQISAGRAHTCVRRNAEVWCWGFNKLGVLGDGRWGGVQLAAKRVEGLPSAASQLFGGNWLQAVLDDTGVAHVWGFNGLGQLGEGSIDGLPCDGDLPCRTSPSRGLGELTGLQSLALTGATAYAVDAEGRVLGWGGVGYGGLGRQPGAAGDRPDCRHADYPLKVCNPTPAPIEGLPTP